LKLTVSKKKSNKIEIALDVSFPISQKNPPCQSRAASVVYSSQGVHTEAREMQKNA
jgi:hypothetical protein